MATQALASGASSFLEGLTKGLIFRRQREIQQAERDTDRQQDMTDWKERADYSDNLHQAAREDERNWQRQLALQDSQARWDIALWEMSMMDVPEAKQYRDRLIESRGKLFSDAQAGRYAESIVALLRDKQRQYAADVKLQEGRRYAESQKIAEAHAKTLAGIASMTGDVGPEGMMPFMEQFNRYQDNPILQSMLVEAMQRKEQAAQRPPTTHVVNGRLMGWNPKTRQFDIDYGAAGNGAGASGGYSEKDVAELIRRRKAELWPQIVAQFRKLDADGNLPKGERGILLDGPGSGRYFNEIPQDQQENYVAHELAAKIQREIRNGLLPQMPQGQPQAQGQMQAQGQFSPASDDELRQALLASGGDLAKAEALLNQNGRTGR